MRNYAARKRIAAMKRDAARLMQKVFLLMCFLAALGLVMLLCGCQADPFDEMFEAAARQNVMQMQNPPQLGVQKTWREWQNEAH